MRIGLVLGAGGVVGAAWLAGALEALRDQTGLDAGSADVVVGSSAGALIGTLAAAGATPEAITQYLNGGRLDPVIDAEARAESLTERIDITAFKLHKGLPAVGPGSWKLAMETLRHPRSHSMATMVSGWLPRGFVSTEPVVNFIDHMTGGEWPDHPGLWIVASDYETGKRVVFGREGAPYARVGDAVAASCALPAFFRPVKIGGRTYVDGGICSTSNLDVVRGQGLDAVICLNPTSSLVSGGGRSPAARAIGLVRAEAGRRLGHEARKLRAEGTDAMLIQPLSEDLPLLGSNLMSSKHRAEIAETAYRTVARDLRVRRDEFAAVRSARRGSARRRSSGRRAA